MSAPEEAKSEVEAAFEEYFLEYLMREEYKTYSDSQIAKEAFAAGAEFGRAETVKLIKEGK